jgi:hypothetical protein
MTTPVVNTKVDVKTLIRDEYKKCATDPLYFINNYCYIQHPIRGRVLFKLYPYQSKAIQDFEGFQYNVILKGRQIGISTAVACYALWLMLFHKDKNVLVIATKQDTAKNLITKVRFAFDSLPIWLQVQCTENNKLSLKFKNGSQIKAVTAAADSARSEALSLLILDEAAFIREAEEIWVSALPTLSTGGKAVLISTPNGMGNFFHRMYTNAVNDLNAGMEVEHEVKLNPIKLDWRVHPERDQGWRDQMGKIQGERAARQEYDAEFIGSGNTVIDGDVVEFYKTKCMEPAYKRGFDGNVWVWEAPNYAKNYIVVADVARGDGTDFSAFHVMEVTDCRQVAEYKGKVGTTEYAHMLVTIATEYNDALLVVERENVGWAVLQVIINRGYKNLFYMTNDLAVVEVERNLTTRYNAEQRNMVAGFTTSSRTRPLVISKLDTYMREKACNILSLRLISELEVFIWNNGKAEAMAGYNDDLVMSFGIGLWIRDTAMRLHQEGIELTRNALDSIKRVEYEGIYSTTNLPVDPYRLKLGSGENQTEDLRWLLG